MFNKSSSRPGTGDITFIAEECQISGTVTIKGNARIDGKLDGYLQATGDITIGQNALLNANIEAKTVSIAGEVHGDIQTVETLELSSTARLYGDIYTKQLRVDQGALFIGTSRLFEENSSSRITPFPEQHVHTISDNEQRNEQRNDQRNDKRKMKAAEG